MWLTQVAKLLWTSRGSLAYVLNQLKTIGDTSWGCFVLPHCNVYCVWSRSPSVWSLAHAVGISSSLYLHHWCNRLLRHISPLKCKARDNDDNGTNYFPSVVSQIWLFLREYNAFLVFYLVFSSLSLDDKLTRRRLRDEWSFLSNLAILRGSLVAIQKTTEITEKRAWLELLQYSQEERKVLAEMSVNSHITFVQ